MRCPLHQIVLYLKLGTKVVYINKWIITLCKTLAKKKASNYIWYQRQTAQTICGPWLDRQIAEGTAVTWPPDGNMSEVCGSSECRALHREALSHPGNFLSFTTAWHNSTTKILLNNRIWSDLFWSDLFFRQAKRESLKCSNRILIQTNQHKTVQM